MNLGKTKENEKSMGTEKIINCKKITHEDYIRTDKWFAWRPVRTTNAGWVWWKFVNRTIDERSEVYLGLLPEYSYFL